MCHVSYFINGDEQKLTVRYFLHYDGLNFIFFSDVTNYKFKDEKI